MTSHDSTDGNVAKFTDHFVTSLIGKISFSVLPLCNSSRNLKIIKILSNNNVCDSLGLLWLLREDL